MRIVNENVHGKLESLDGLRALAALMVLLSHLSNNGMDLVPGLRLSGIGRHGVFLFFVLSAFLLTRPLLARSRGDRSNPGRWRDYLIRRSLRILPLYWLVLVVSYILTASFGFTELSRQELLEHMTLFRGKEIFWTIPVECTYYLWLPFVAIVLRRMRDYGVGAATVALPFFALGVTGALDPPGTTPTDTFPQYAGIFLIGSVTALIHHELAALESRDATRVRRIVDWSGAFAAATIVALTPSVASVLTGTQVESGYLHHAYATLACLWALCLLATASDTGPLRRIFESRALRTLGTLSFSIYLWHYPVIRSVAQHVDAPPSCKAALVIGLTLAVAALSYRYVERPSLRLARRLTTRTGAPHAMRALEAPSGRGIQARPAPIAAT